MNSTHQWCFMAILKVFLCSKFTNLTAQAEANTKGSWDGKLASSQKCQCICSC